MVIRLSDYGSGVRVRWLGARGYMLVLGLELGVMVRVRFDLAALSLFCF